MRKYLILGVLTVFMALSCSTPRNAQPSVSKYDLKGVWQITNVDYDKQYKIKPFNEGVDISCFVGSQWNLVPNNGKGSYHLTGTGCPAIDRNIMFNVTRDNQFSFKVVPEGMKAKNVEVGYFLRLANQTPSSFDLVQSLSEGGNPLTVVYHFQKIN